MFTRLQYNILRKLSPGDPPVAQTTAYDYKNKLDTLLGPGLSSRIVGRVVIDFGCGEGGDSIEMAEHGAAKVIGVDVQQRYLDAARVAASNAGVGPICEFTTSAKEPADVLVSVNAFEHFVDPEGTLEAMCRLLKPGGQLLIAFGPTWYHPHGGHIFSIFPWAHLLFSEEALIRWRSDLRSDGARHFHEVEGGLNKMTVHRFEEMVKACGLAVVSFETIPIRQLRFIHMRFTREFTTSVVRCALVKRP